MNRFTSILQIIRQRPFGARGPATGAALAAAMLVALSPMLLAQRSHAAPTAAQPDAMLVRDGERLTVPAGSPLRSHLLVTATSQSSDTHGLAFPAVVEADSANTVNILPPVTGRVVALPVRLGDAVRAGQVLVVMTSADSAAATSDIEKARDAMAAADRMLERARGVNAAGGNATKDLEQAQSNRNQADSELRRAQARLDALGIAHDAHAKGGQIEIRSPIAGVVTALNIGNGGFANDPSATLMTVANLATVWITANVPEADAAHVARGLHADITLPGLPGVTLHGKVGFSSAVLDADTRRMKARIVMPNADGKLKPNMFATVTLAIPAATQTMVPPSALLMNNESTTVFVEVAPWVFVRRAVEVGRDEGEMVRIESGLRPGERVVVRGGVLLND